MSEMRSLKTEGGQLREHVLLQYDRHAVGLALRIILLMHDSLFKPKDRL
jgi:hypothetical protein